MTLHQPTDTLLPTDELIFVSTDEESQHRIQFVTLEVTNHGRSQLDDVEAVLTPHQRIGPIPAEQHEDSDVVPAFDVPVDKRSFADTGSLLPAADWMGVENPRRETTTNRPAERVFSTRALRIRSGLDCRPER